MWSANTASSALSVALSTMPESVIDLLDWNALTAAVVAASKRRVRATAWPASASADCSRLTASPLSPALSVAVPPATFSSVGSPMKRGDLKTFSPIFSFASMGS
ncbi:MAG TPA: hypothetical protein VGD37_11655 [Kofleriaceae bacterium]